MTATDVTYPLYPIFAFIGFVLSLIPLPWHLQAWNSGTCYFMMWAALACLNQFINSVVWSDNAVNSAPIWCEISIRVLLGSSVGLPAASLCINRRLYQIATMTNRRTGHVEKSRAILIDTLVCVLFPLVFVALQYVVQGHRFNIFEEVGCYPAIYNTLATYFLNFMWPILIGLISASYCIRTLVAFTRRRLEFTKLVTAKNPALTMSRYFRLMALATCDIFFTTPLAIFDIWLNVTNAPIAPWVSWDYAHFDYSRVDQIPSIFWKSDRIGAISIQTTRWVAPLCAFVFFAFFGFADEARKNYRIAFCWVMKYVRRALPSLPTKREKFPDGHQFLSSTISETATLPMYSPPPSSYPVFDIKRPDSFTRPQDTPPCFVLEKTMENGTKAYDPSEDSDQHLSPPPETNRTRFSWRSISVPFSDRRHSSYF